MPGVGSPRCAAAVAEHGTTGGSSPELDAYEAAGVDPAVTVDAGCQWQLPDDLRRRGGASGAVHLADLLAAAAGGRPLPRGRRWRVPRVRFDLRRGSRRRGAGGGTAGWSA